jgi:hypothetical protein
MSSARPKTIGARRKDLAAAVKAIRDSNVGRLRTTAGLIFVYDVISEPLRCYQQSGLALFLISRTSQTLASFQSRRTVSGETFSTRAVSSALRPPKKRNSTT